MFSLLFVALTLASYAQGASQIALFTDENCQASYKGLEGPNGYPNGSCTDIRRSGTFGSLQVVSLDPGCAVTIYVNDPSTTICGGLQQEVRLGECWNSTFVYYSIDMCDISAIGQTPSSTPSPSSSASASASASVSPTAVPLSGPSVGAIAGGVIGGVVALGLIAGLVAWFLIKKRRARRTDGFMEHNGPAEMYAGMRYERHEMSDGPVTYKSHAVEVAQPPAELGGHELRQDEKQRAMH